MNKWIFNHYAIAPGSSGGTRHYDLAMELVKKGHEVTIFASSFEHQTRKESHIQESNLTYKENNYDGITFIWIKTTPYQKNNWRRIMNILSYSFRTYLLIQKKFKNRPDFVIGSLMHPLAALLGYIISYQKKASFILKKGISGLRP
jgi:hypothetical protein